MIIKKCYPKEKEINELFQSVGWESRKHECFKSTKKSSCSAISLYDDNKHIIGMGRIVGDGVFYTIFDLVIKKEFQRQGFGTIIMNQLLEYFRKVKNPEAILYLGASKGKEDFYKKFGFLERPNEYVGAGMVLYKEDII